MNGSAKVGHILGNGAAQNIELGFVPDYVRIINATDGDKITEWFAGKYMAFTSGGTTEIAAGWKITGATSGATAYVREVLLASGTWTGGDAAGYLVLDEIVGTFGAENVHVAGGVNDATVTAPVEFANDIDTEVAAATGNAAISSYAGVPGSNAQGFTLGSTVSETGKLFRYLAIRSA